jgi:HK97 family phage portal protein
MGAKLEDWFRRNIWGTSSRGFANDELATINGTLLQSILSGDGVTDERVSIREGLRIAAVNTCINVRGLTFASLPINVFKEVGDSKKNLSDHPAYWPLSQEPNDYMSAAVFWKTVLLHMDAWGNAYAKINRDIFESPETFDLWEPWKVEMVKEDGQLFYSYDGGDLVPDRDVLHYHWFSLDGICGLSIILENQDTMGMAKKLKRYASLTLGAQPPGVLGYEGNLTPEQRAENKKEWTGGSKGSVKVLSGKWQYTPIMTPGDEVQYSTTKAGNEREIYGLYKIPPTFAQEFSRATYSNAENNDLVYSKHTVTPLATIIEKENNRKLFREREKKSCYTKFNINGLLRGDLAARQAFYQSMVNTGVFSRNEARSLEDMNPYEGGEEFLVQGAMVPADMLREVYQNKLAETPDPAATRKNYVNGYAHN